MVKLWTNDGDVCLKNNPGVRGIGVRYQQSVLGLGLDQTVESAWRTSFNGF